MPPLVGIALLLWFGSVLWAYALGKRADDDSDWVDLPKCSECGNREIHQYGCSLAGPHDRTVAPPPPPAPPDDTDPGRRIKEGGWPPR